MLIFATMVASPSWSKCESGECANGFGAEIGPDGERYEGKFRDGRREGAGTLVYSDGRKYVGDWHEGKKHGRGTFSWPNGESYTGDWSLDKRHGQGTYIYADGAKYEGELKEFKLHGQGIYTWPNGRKYVGEFKNDYITGRGEYSGPWGKNGEFVGYVFDADKKYHDFTDIRSPGIIGGIDAPRGTVRESGTFNELRILDTSKEGSPHLVEGTAFVFKTSLGETSCIAMNLTKVVRATGEPDSVFAVKFTKGERVDVTSTQGLAKCREIRLHR